MTDRATIACRRLPDGRWSCDVQFTEPSGALMCYTHVLWASSEHEAEERIRRALAIRARRLNGGHNGDAKERLERRRGGRVLGAARENAKPKTYGEGKY